MLIEDTLGEDGDYETIRNIHDTLNDMIEEHKEEQEPLQLDKTDVRKVFEKSGVTVWECRNCGHIVVGTKAPDVCPVCKHPQSYFEVRKENY